MRTLENLQMDGGCLVFDFVNTVNTRKPAPEFEYLKTFEDVLEWSAKVGSVDDEKLNALRKYAAQKPENSLAALQDVIETREMLYELFSSIATGNVPGEAVIAAFNRRLSFAFQRINIVFGPERAAFRFGDDDLFPGEPLLPVLKSASEIVTNQDFARIKECPRCGWLFLDSTKNGKRKWCDMNVCGSREKSLEYYYRKTKARHTL